MQLWTLWDCLTEVDAKAEGAVIDYEKKVIQNYLDKRTHRIYVGELRVENYREAYERLWDSINKPPYDWDSNYWVWAYSFRMVRWTEGLP